MSMLGQAERERRHGWSMMCRVSRSNPPNPSPSGDLHAVEFEAPFADVRWSPLHVAAGNNKCCAECGGPLPAEESGRWRYFSDGL